MGTIAGLRHPGRFVMTFAEHFSVVDNAVGPQPWMQLRCVKTAEVASVSKNYDPNDGLAKNDLLQTLDASWTNNSTVNQYVYGMVTKSGSQVSLQCRSRGYLSTSHGVIIAATNSALTTVEASRFGVGTDLGLDGLLAFGGAFGISELRQNSTTIPLMPQLTGWFLVAAGATIHARVEVRFVSEYWENTQITGGDADTESKTITGDLRLDLFAVPTVSTPKTRATPTLVGGTSNVKTATTVTNPTSVTTPSGVTTGDQIVAVVVNQFGLASDMNPVQTGWNLLHSRNDGADGLHDVHMKIYVRSATASEPASYSFTNSFLAEQTAVLIGLRSSVSITAVEGVGWYAASNLSRYKIFEDHVAPSVNKSGQMLIAASYINHNALLLLTQTVPPGMTSLVQVSPEGTSGSLCIAYLNNPPSPTLERKFTTSYNPLFNGHTIAASIVVPGSQQ